MLEARDLARDEIKKVWTIDRAEAIEGFYRLVDGALVLERQHHDVKGWPPGEADKYTPILEASFDRGGWFLGMFDAEKLVGAAVLDSRFIGSRRDQLQLEFLHVSRDYRHSGLGKRLFCLAVAEARRRGARGMYVSATPSENTIRFYRRLGCEVTPEPDPELFALEPEDIHLVCNLEMRRR